MFVGRDEQLRRRDHRWHPANEQSPSRQSTTRITARKFQLDWLGWGVHWLDIVQMAFDEQMPRSIAAMGEKFRLRDNRDTPDTLYVVYEYPGFIGTYENREGNKQSMFKKPGGILFCGDQATLYVDRSSYILISEKSDADP